MLQFILSPQQLQLSQVIIRRYCLYLMSVHTPLTNVIDILHHYVLYQHTILQYISTYLDQLGPSGKSVEISTKLTCLEITSYRLKYRLLELQIRCGRKVQMQVHTVNSNG